MSQRTCDGLLTRFTQGCAALALGYCHSARSAGWLSFQTSHLIYPRISLLILIVCSLPVYSFAQLPVANPATVSVSARHLTQMDDVINKAIAERRLPGAVVLVGRNGRIAWRKAYGSRAVEPSREAMTMNTIFDVASLTKVVVTATSIMILVEQGK
ncbi:MAG: beta-lactamase family protein, partial [Acidobacteriota bacterium]|nr:beta-lactamase family protein [Acidobacteriota bacterium]